jgi:hypothetical protein
MRMWAVLAGACAWAVCGVAHAETWGIQPTLDKSRSAGGCGDSTPPSTLTLAGDKLTLKAGSGTYDFKVAGDGTVNQVYKTSTGMTLRFIGNAKTRDPEFVNENAGCRYKAVVKQ